VLHTPRRPHDSDTIIIKQSLLLSNVTPSNRTHAVHPTTATSQQDQLLPLPASEWLIIITLLMLSIIMIMPRQQQPTGQLLNPAGVEGSTLT
jgi:hypothetical protein